MKILKLSELYVVPALTYLPIKVRLDKFDKNCDL